MHKRHTHIFECGNTIKKSYLDDKRWKYTCMIAGEDIRHAHSSVFFLKKLYNLYYTRTFSHFTL